MTANINPRQFIDWNQQPLPAAAEWLGSRHAANGILNLTDVIIVVPTSRSSRRLRELLLDYAAQNELVYTPPQVTTIGTFPELLYVPQRPLASPLTQTLAWVSALKKTPEKAIREFTQLVPQHDDSIGWQTLAKVLAKWHIELAGNQKTFKDVLEAGTKTDFFQEKKRWQTLADIQREYLDVLNRENLWDRQTARLVAIQHEECRIDKQVYLVGTVDLNLTSRAMLEQVGNQVTPVVFSADEHHDFFDDLGCLLIEPWENYQIPVNDADFKVGDQPQDQAKLVANFLHELDGQYGVDQISIGAPDPRLISSISRSLMGCGVKTYDVGGSSISNSRAFVMLELLAAWIDGFRFESFAELVRHPDIYAWVTEQMDSDRWLGELDRYQNNRLPFSLSTNPKSVFFGGNDRHGKPQYKNLQQAWASLSELVAPLVGGEQRLLEQWSEPWRKVMATVYEKTQVDRDNSENRRTIRACKAIIKAFIEIEESGRLMTSPVSSNEAAVWALDLCSDQFVADPAVSDAISIVGWLDSALEDTPVSVITSVNEGFLPSSENSSLFLPNSIRSELDLVDNRRRYVRDAYSLSMILASRERVLLTVGRRDGEGQPQLPSRLLLTGEQQQIPGRALQLFAHGEDTSQWVYGQAKSRPREQQFRIPHPSDFPKTVNRMRVTDFKQYIACPYRFYLNRVLNLTHLSDVQFELDGGQFGSLLHDVVENFGRSELKNSSNAEDIEAYLLDELDRIAGARYGTRTLPTVFIQLEQARTRLRAFATWQGEHRRDGYEIHEVEKEKTQCEFLIDGEPFVVSGQIDRIDLNHEKKTIGLYDYKTGDKAEAPKQMHQDKFGDWKDLQLPLYHHLLGSFDLPHGYDIETGIILVTKDINEVRLRIAEWTKVELEDATQTALEIMQKVRQGVFWPPAENKHSWDDFAAICQTHVFEKWESAPNGENS